MEQDQVQSFKFENAIVQALKSNNTLHSVSDAKQKDLLFTRKTSPNHILTTLDAIIDAVDLYRQTLAYYPLRGIYEARPENKGRQIAAEQRKQQLKHLKQLVQIDIPVKTIPGIVDGITIAIRQGWLRGGMVNAYIQAPRPWLPTPGPPPLAPAPAPRLTRPPYGRAARATRQSYGRSTRGLGRGRGSGRGRTQSHYTPPQAPAPAQTTSTSAAAAPRPPIQLYTRRQYASHIRSVPDAQLGTRIDFTRLKYRRQYCNNFQVWGTCAVFQKNPVACTYLKRCSNCDQQDHGRRTCPNLPSNEDPNA